MTENYASLDSRSSTESSLRFLHPHHFLEMFETLVKEPIGSYQIQYLNNMSTSKHEQLSVQYMDKKLQRNLACYFTE